MILAAVVSAAAVLVTGGLAARTRRVERRARAHARLAAPASVSRVSASWGTPLAGRRITLLATAPPRLVSSLEAAGSAVDPVRCWRAWCWSVLTSTTVLAVMAGPGAGLLGMVLTSGGPPVLLAALRGRGAVRLDASLAALLEDVARGLRSGASLRQAVVSATASGSGPLVEDLAQAMVRVDRGADFGAEVDRWGQRRSSPSLPLAVAALTMAAETGGAQARALDRVATTVRDRLAVRSEQAALGAQARASALVMGVTPVAFALLAGVTDPRTADFLLRRTAGLACLTLGLSLDAVALVWMLRITGGDA